MSPTSVVSHGCVSRFQDELYGRGMRVFNQTDKGRRCTVCGGEIGSGGLAAEPVKKNPNKNPS